MLEEVEKRTERIEKLAAGANAKFDVMLKAITRFASPDQLAKLQLLEVKPRPKSEYPQPIEKYQPYDWSNNPKFQEAFQFAKYGWYETMFIHEKKGTSAGVVNGKEMVNFCSYDYLGLSFHPEVCEASHQAVLANGNTASASRVAGGQLPIHLNLEKTIASIYGAEEAIVYLGGHTCNTNALRTLLDSSDVCFMDFLAHNSIREGVKYSGCQKHYFKHNDAADLERLLKENRHLGEKAFIIIEGVYSMDGDVPDLAKFVELKKKYNCVLYCDEAHSLGVLGKSGRGISEHCGIKPSEVDIWMGSLAKAFGSCGGFIAGTKPLVYLLKAKSPGYFFSVGLNPASAGAATKSIQLSLADTERRERLHKNVALFYQLCVEYKIPILPSHPMAPLVLVFCGKLDKCKKVFNHCHENGVFVSPGIYPAVPADKSRLRFFINAEHSETQLRHTAELLKQAFDVVGRDV